MSKKYRVEKKGRGGSPEDADGELPRTEPKHLNDHVKMLQDLRHRIGMMSTVRSKVKKIKSTDPSGLGSLLLEMVDEVIELESPLYEFITGVPIAIDRTKPKKSKRA